MSLPFTFDFSQTVRNAFPSWKSGGGVPPRSRPPHLCQLLVLHVFACHAHIFSDGKIFWLVAAHIAGIYCIVFQGYINVLSRPVVISRAVQSVWTNVYVDSSVGFSLRLNRCCRARMFCRRSSFLDVPVSSGEVRSAEFL